MKKSALFLVFGSPILQIVFGTLFLVISILAGLAFESIYEFVDDKGVTHHAPVWTHVAEELVRDLGIAFFVAAAIHYSVESFASEERSKIFSRFKEEANQKLEEISSNTLNSYFKRELPDGWFDFVHQQIDDHSFMRRNGNIDVTLSEVDSGVSKIISENNLPEYIRYSTIMTYRVDNISKFDDEYSVRKFTEFPLSDELREFTKITDLKIDGKSLDPSELNKADANWSDTDNHKMAGHSVPIPSGGSVDVEVKSETLKLKNDAMVWICNGPMLNATFRIQAPKDFVLIFACMHPASTGNLNKVSTNGEPIIHNIEGPLPSFTSAEIRWVSQEIVGNQYVKEAD